MARESKFRAWSQDDEQMMIPNDEEHSSSWDWGSTAFGAPEILTGENWNADKSAILMQYTGLTDKNGTEIYEGDVVQIPCDRKCIIKYADHISAFVLVEIGGNKISNNLLLKIDYASYEVIGNIHKNPELI